MGKIQRLPGISLLIVQSDFATTSSQLVKLAWNFAEAISARYVSCVDAFIYIYIYIYICHIILELLMLSWCYSLSLCAYVATWHFNRVCWHDTVSCCLWHHILPHVCHSWSTEFQRCQVKHRLHRPSQQFSMLLLQDESIACKIHHAVELSNVIAQPAKRVHVFSCCHSL